MSRCTVSKAIQRLLTLLQLVRAAKGLSETFTRKGITLPASLCIWFGCLIIVTVDLAAVFSAYVHCMMYQALHWQANLSSYSPSRNPLSSERMTEALCSVAWCAMYRWGICGRGRVCLCLWSSRTISQTFWEIHSETVESIWITQLPWRVLSAETRSGCESFCACRCAFASVE